MEFSRNVFFGFFMYVCDFNVICFLLGIAGYFWFPRYFTLKDKGRCDKLVEENLKRLPRSGLVQQRLHAPHAASACSSLARRFSVFKFSLRFGKLARLCSPTSYSRVTLSEIAFNIRIKELQDEGSRKPKITSRT